MKGNRKTKIRQKKQFNALKANIINETFDNKVPTVCPYCHSRMIVKKIGDLDPLSPKADQLICVCEHYYDTCTCSVKVKMKKGKMLMLGVPADENLKSLRTEAHYYLDYLVDFNILQKNDAYQWLANNIGILDGQMHFSMLREERCRNAIRLIIEVLSRNTDKIEKNIQPYQPKSHNVTAYSESDEYVRTLLKDMLQQDAR